MKSSTAAVLASLLSAAYAAPAASACDLETTVTVSCTTIVTTITPAAAAATDDACPAEVTITVPPSADAAPTPAAGGGAAGVNIQSFTGALGGISPPPVVSGTGNRPFTVNGDTFVGSGAALGRSCDVQHNKCANAANSGQLSGGVAQCDQQNNECRSFNSVNARRHAFKARAVLESRAADFGTCSDPTIVFKAGLDGRNSEAFIANNQGDFNHGSALNIAVIAGFICQRLGSPCNADAAAQSACSSASAAAVATSQDQAAADVFNSILAGGAAAAAPTEAPAATITSAPVLASTASSALAGQTGVIVSTIVSCA